MAAAPRFPLFAASWEGHGAAPELSHSALMGMGLEWLLEGEAVSSAAAIVTRGDAPPSQRAAAPTHAPPPAEVPWRCLDSTHSTSCSRYVTTLGIAALRGAKS